MFSGHRVIENFAGNDRVVYKQVPLLLQRVSAKKRNPLQISCIEFEMFCDAASQVCCLAGTRHQFTAAEPYPALTKKNICNVSAFGVMKNKVKSSDSALLRYRYSVFRYS